MGKQTKESCGCQNREDKKKPKGRPKNTIP